VKTISQQDALSLTSPAEVRKVSSRTLRTFVAEVPAYEILSLTVEFTFVNYDKKYYNPNDHGEKRWKK